MGVKVDNSDKAANARTAAAHASENDANADGKPAASLVDDLRRNFQAAPVEKPPVENNIPSLKYHLGAGFAVLTLALTLVPGVLATRISGIDGLPGDMTRQLYSLVLWWGFGAVILAGLLGAVIARQVAAPINKLAQQLVAAHAEKHLGLVEVQQNYKEVEVLSRAMNELATMIHGHEQNLAENERKFREAFDLVGVGLCQIDMDGKLLLVNRRFGDMLGYSAGELVGKNFLDLTHVDDQTADPDLARQHPDLADAEIHRDRRYIRKDGSVLWAQYSGVLVRDPAGNPIYGLASIEDVSESRASEETLRALNASLKAIVETSPMAIYSLTTNGVVTLWNPAAEKMFGLNELQVLGQPSPLTTGRSADKALALRVKVLAGETLHGFEISVDRTNSDGAIEQLELSVAAAPLLGVNGNIVGVLTTCTDITDMKETSRKLDEQLRFTNELLQVMPNPIFYMGKDQKYLGVNRAWEQFFGKVRSDWIGKTYAEVFQDDLAGEIELEDASVLHGTDLVREVRVRDSQGVERDIVKHISRFTNQNGSAAGVIGVLTDITPFKQAAIALQKTEGRFQALTESAMDIVTVLDRNAVIIYQSPSVKHLLGYDTDAMIGKCQFDLIHRDDVERMRVAFSELLETGSMSRAIEFRAMALDGTWRILESIGKSCLDDPAVQGIIVNTRDVSERRAIQEHIQHLAFHDALTGLPNRSLIQDRISQALTRADRGNHRLAVMFIDIDNFKNINDTLGHDAGDELLREVSRRLRDSVRGHDTIARQGGDEFIVLLDQLDDHQGATRVAQKILDALRTAFMVGGTGQHVSGSIGISIFPEDGSDAQTLLKNADTAMFHGKALGKNTYQFFTGQMNIAVKRRAAMESNLRAAVNNEDFLLVYQPQIDLVSGEIVALEALVRWNSEDSGTMMPGEFIPLAEETGLINELGEWVLREACRQNKEWQDAGLAPRRMAVNLSAKQLNDKGFIAMLVGILRETQLDPTFLELEITESQVMRQGEGSVMLLNEIAEMGIHLSIDDFGTGYSSLSYLKRLPIGKLKIDQSFIRDITVDPNDTAIVVAIINMAKSLDLEVIAEGIETAGQLTLLRAKGCGVGQGYYFSVPLDADSIAVLLKQTSVFDNGRLVSTLQ